MTDITDPTGELLAPPAPPPPAGSVLDQIDQLVAQAQDDVELVIRAPGYSPPLWLSCRPLSEEEYQESLRRHTTPGRGGKVAADWRVWHATDLVVRACQGIFIAHEGRRYAPIPGAADGPLPTFGAALQPFLGIDAGDQATLWARAFFRCDGRLIAFADELVARSGYGDRAVKELLEGE